MIKDIINDFRRYHGIEPAQECEPVEHEHCKFHCLHMAKNYHIEHTPAHLLNGKAEIVASCEFQKNMEETEKALIWKVIWPSIEHREILLYSKYLAHYLYIDNYRAYLTVRGWS